MDNSLWEPNFDRILTVLRREGEPDRVPFFELFHDREVIEAIMGSPTPDGEEGRRYHIEFMLRLNYDYVFVPHAFTFPLRQARMAENTAPLAREQRGWRDDYGGPIQSWKDLETYPWSEVKDSDFEEIERIEPLLPDGMKVTTTLPGGVLENLVDLMGYEPLCFAVVDQPDLVQAIVDRIGAAELAVYKQLCQYEHIGALWLNDDLGFKTQTMISPQDLRRYIFPWHKRLVEYAHAHGRPVMLHACGNVEEVMEDIIEDVGVEAMHSFEDVIEPVAEFKRKYGDRVAALGGIDMDVLTRGNEDEVRQYTRRAIEQCAPGGGWALGSGNSVANYIPTSNFLAMLDEGRTLGVYED